MDVAEGDIFSICKPLERQTLTEEFMALQGSMESLTRSTLDDPPIHPMYRCLEDLKRLLYLFIVLDCD